MPRKDFCMLHKEFLHNFSIKNIDGSIITQLHSCCLRILSAVVSFEVIVQAILLYGSSQIRYQLEVSNNRKVRTGYVNSTALQFIKLYLGPQYSEYQEIPYKYSVHDAIVQHLTKLHIFIKLYFFFVVECF
jgi:hypothetical protein